MDIVIRRVGSSLGIIIPKSQLVAWNLGEGDRLSVTDRGILPRKALDADEDKWRHALAVVDRFSPQQIRAKSVANLLRWKQAGAWVSAYDEWREIMNSRDDGVLFAAMLGRDERSIRLRQSMPYVGLLSREQVKALNDQAAG
jgi:antitoxin component of MazEF toxin-antitoxin module